MCNYARKKNKRFYGEGFFYEYSADWFVCSVDFEKQHMQFVDGEISKKVTGDSRQILMVFRYGYKRKAYNLLCTMHWPKTLGIIYNFYDAGGDGLLLLNFVSTRAHPINIPCQVYLSKSASSHSSSFIFTFTFSAGNHDFNRA